MGFSELQKWKAAPKRSVAAVGTEHSPVEFKWDLGSGFLCVFFFLPKVSCLSLLDTPCLVTATSALNEGVNEHLLHLSAQGGCTAAQTLQGGRSKRGLIRGLFYHTKMSFRKHVIPLQTSDVACVTQFLRHRKC